MPAPPNNKFWKKRSKHGKDMIFNSPEVMWDAACEYFEDCVNNPIVVQEIHSGKRLNVKKLHAFTMRGLCLFLGVNNTYFYDFVRKNEAAPDSDIKHQYIFVIEQIRDTIHTQKLTAAYAGAINPNIAIRDLGLKETIESTNNNNNINDSPLKGLSFDELMQLKYGK